VALGLMLAYALSFLGPLAETLVIAILLAQRSLVQHVQAVANGLRTSLAEGRSAVSMIVSRDTSDMDGPGVTRSAIESAAENMSDGFVAPAFWALLFGLPGILVYKMVNTADSMIGYRNERYEQFGWASARLDDVLNLIPARLTGLLIAGLSGQMGKWRGITQDARRHRSPNAGWPEAAMARALDVALAGPRSYDGQMQDLAWVNETGQKQSGPQDIDAAIALLWKTWSAFALAVFLIGVFQVAT
jgi:adenosylcobinamide-phosphate synthase